MDKRRLPCLERSVIEVGVLGRVGLELGQSCLGPGGVVRLGVQKENPEVSDYRLQAVASALCWGDTLGSDDAVTLRLVASSSAG
jgi:hypothetical protein